MIKKWWRDNPDANIGIAMGPKSKLIAIDIDPRNGGKKSLRKKEKKLGKLPDTVTTLTGGSGQHYIFNFPNFPVRKDSNGKLLGRGIDVLAKGSIMIVPPSRHILGKRYRWEEGKSLLEIKPADLPDAWLACLRATRNRTPLKTASLMAVVATTVLLLAQEPYSVAAFRLTRC